jgi:hypothetical protein
MCRNFNVCLSPMKIEDLFFEKRNGDSRYFVRSRESIHSNLQNRTLYARAVAEDCSKKCTKAGYDAGGMAVGFISLDPIWPYLDTFRDDGSAFSSAEIATLANEFYDRLHTSVKGARDGGDLMRTWDSLIRRLDLDDEVFVTDWETHVRQATQGDMYSESNAHPLQELLTSDRVRIYHLTPTGDLTCSEHERTLGESIFSDAHNGDIIDAPRYKRFLTREGFRFISNSDTCVEPALKRFLYEHLRSGELAGALHRLAFTDPDFTDGADEVVGSNGYAGSYHYLVGREWADQTLTVAIEGSRISFLLKNGQRVGNFVQCGFLRDDERSLASEKIAELLTLAGTMGEEGAHEITIATAVTARILEYSHPKTKFVFQSFTPVGRPKRGFLGGGTYTSVRGGMERGGEAGGESIFHLPKPYDQRTYGRIALLSASEENALKEQVALLDPVALAHGRTQLAQAEVLEITSLADVRATAYITEGVAPIFDVLPGEILEVTADGRISIFDIYRGCTVRLVTLDGCDPNTGDPIDKVQWQDCRRERLASLKVFKIDYCDLEGHPIPCPYNKYGEEIMVIQPLALRRNTEKLFSIASDGTIRLRTGTEGIGLTMGTDVEALRCERIKRLTHVITGGAGTSYLINTIAPIIARKLGLNTLPVINFDGFTGSDTIPPYVGEGTLFLANSNSGGTADTIRLAHEISNQLSILSRIETEFRRRDPSISEVREALSYLPEIRAALKDGVEWEDLPPHLREFLDRKAPWVYVVTNIEASGLGNIGRGLETAVHSAAGAGITNLPEEESVGSTFAAMASLQWQIALYTYIGEVRGDISPTYAAQIYSELARLPEVAEQIVGDAALIAEIKRMADELVGGNFDFVYTGYLDGVPEEQAHKGAEMIQEMFAGWHFFQFQHGKYAHMKRRTRHALGSILGHNVPPPSWPVFNNRALKSPYEVGPRVATTFFIAHKSDREALQGVPDYAPDFIFTYPADSIALYPLQVIIIAQLISYFWGLKKKEIGEQIKRWNEPFVAFLLEIAPEATSVPDALRFEIESHAQLVLNEFLSMCKKTHYLDKIEGQRKTAIINALSLLACKGATFSHDYTYTGGGFLRSETRQVTLSEQHQPAQPLDDATLLTILKDLALELCNMEQAKRLADHFLVDDRGSTLPHQIEVSRPQGRVRRVHEYDYLIEYEGLGTYFDVEPVHPPKIAKAKKGWL